MLGRPTRTRYRSAACRESEKVSRYWTWRSDRFHVKTVISECAQQQQQSAGAGSLLRPCLSRAVKTQLVVKRPPFTRDWARTIITQQSTAGNFEKRASNPITNRWLSMWTETNRIITQQWTSCHVIGPVRATSPRKKKKETTTWKCLKEIANTWLWNGVQRFDARLWQLIISPFIQKHLSEKLISKHRMLRILKPLSYTYKGSRRYIRR